MPGTATSAGPISDIVTIGYVRIIPKSAGKKREKLRVVWNHPQKFKYQTGSEFLKMCGERVATYDRTRIKSVN